jgi:hypothetical protein
MWRKNKNLKNLLYIASFAFGFFAFSLFPHIANASPGINSELSFEGKIVNASGVNITNATYNVEFTMYTGCTNEPTNNTGCALTWTEDYLTSAAQGVVFNGGTFQVNLGQYCAFSGGTCQGNSNIAINWYTFPIYMSMQIGQTTNCTPSGNFTTNCTGDSVMQPYILLTSTPYALDSNELGGITSSGYVQLSPGSAQTGNINIGSGTISSGAINGQTISTSAVLTGTLAIQGASALTLGLGSNNGSEIFVSSGGSNTVTLQAPTTNPISSYVLSLPTTTPGTSQCLESGASTATQLSFGACSTLQSAYNNGNSVNTTAAGTLSITASAPPTADIVSISNSGQATTTANSNGLGINYSGGNAAVEGAGLRIDYAPGGTTGGTWDGLRIVANATGPVSGVTSYGLKLEGPTSAGAGTAEAVYIGTGWNIGVDIQSGGIQLAAQSDPASPAANNLKIYAKSIAGLVTPEWISATDQNTPFQPGLGFYRIAYSEPNGTANCSTGATGFGAISTGAGTCTSPAPTSASLFTSVRMENYSSTATAGTVAYQKQSVLQVWRGNAANLGGFFYTIRFGIGTLVSGNRVFVGLVDSVVAPTNVDPTTSTTPGKLGLAINVNTGDWNFVNNITGTAPTVTSLGASFPVNNTDLYELIMYCPENGSTITYRVSDESTGAQTTASVSTNIPASTTFLAPNFWITNNATAAAAILDFNGWYIQSDN